MSISESDSEEVTSLRTLHPSLRYLTCSANEAGIDRFAALASAGIAEETLVSEDSDVSETDDSHISPHGSADRAASPQPNLPESPQQCVSPNPSSCTSTEPSVLDDSVDVPEEDGHEAPAQDDFADDDFADYILPGDFQDDEVSAMPLLCVQHNLR